jgi:hypothetical protein
MDTDADICTEEEMTWTQRRRHGIEQWERKLTKKNYERWKVIIFQIENKRTLVDLYVKLISFNKQYVNLETSYHPFWVDFHKKFKNNPLKGVASFYRDCCTSLSSAESGIIGKSKNRRRTADCFYLFLWCLRFFIKFNKQLYFEETDRKCLKYVETCWVIGRGVFLLPIGWKPGRNAPIGSPRLLGHFPKCLHYSKYCWKAEVGRPLLWSTTHRTTEMIANQRTGKKADQR